MAFYGLEFVYNGVSSVNFNLYITTINSQGISESNLGSAVELITKKILRNPVEFLYGVEQTPVLEFDLEFTSPSPLSAADRSIISAWLFGQQSRGKLQIVQEDLQNIYFTCILDSSKTTYVGNVCYGFKAHVVCDSPFAWENPKVVGESSLGNVVTDKVISLLNTSADSYYTFPVVTFTTNSIGTYFTITNVTDNNREFSFTNILANETITADCGSKVITTNSGLLRVANFSLEWLRLIRGVNSLHIQGGISAYSITYRVASKVGG